MSFNEKHVTEAQYGIEGIVDYWAEQVETLSRDSLEATLTGDTHRALKNATLAKYLSEQIENAQDFLSRKQA